MPRLCSSLLLLLLIGSSASAVTMAWTPVGNPGNACDAQSQGCFGAVGYAYSIGTYEVTNAQYAELLNAKAAFDPHDLYNPYMSSYYGGITRELTPNGYTYSTLAGRENMPVNWVSFPDALRFANWLNNGQGNGDTETGAYTLSGPYTTVTRNNEATMFLVSENEWYKAAYYDAQPSGYFNYPTASDTRPNCTTPTATANTANCGYAVGDLTPKGSYTGSPSPYGTFDQAGNVGEWTDTIATNGNTRILRGGGFTTVANPSFDPDSAAFRYDDYPFDSQEGPYIGFRLAMIPEPGTGLLVIAGLVGLGMRRRACQ